MRPERRESIADDHERAGRPLRQELFDPCLKVEGDAVVDHGAAPAVDLEAAAGRQASVAGGEDVYVRVAEAARQPVGTERGVTSTGNKKPAVQRIKP